MRLLLINNYDSYADLLAYTLGCVSGVRPTVLYNDALSAEAILAQHYDGIVLSPGPGHPSEPRDFGICAEVIARCQVPLLGVCLGHQGIAMVHGGQVVPASEVKHGKRSNITHNGHPLFACVPSPFMAMRYHSWVVDAAQLPRHVQVLARAGDDNTVMAIGLMGRPVMGVQFHPESVGTKWGRRLLRNFVGMTAGQRPAAQKSMRHQTQTHAAPVRPTAAAWAPNKMRRAQASQRRILLEELPWRAPEEAFARHYAARHYAFWLDTAAPNQAQRWSFMGAPHQVLQSHADGLLRIAACGRKVIVGDPLTAWRRVLEEPPEGAGTLPCPFAGGLVGHMGYEMQRFGHDATVLGLTGDLGAHRHERAIGARHGNHAAAAPSTPNAPPLPDSVMQICRRFLAFDHATQRVYAIAVQRDTKAAAIWLHAMQTSWRERWPASGTTTTVGDCPPGAYWPPQVSPRIDRQSYLRRIAQAQARIAQGDIYEVCLSTRFDAPGGIDPWHLYRILRHTHPAPYAAFLKGPDASVLSASPERFLTLDTAGHIITEPIKGTREHSGTRGALAFQRRQLRHSPKDQAELLMVVDLLRNDLARVAQRNSVRVSDLFNLTNHPTVVQMSATIVAKLRTRYDAIDLLRACFPGGSITGAPKRRAMEIIDALEGAPRGVYTGAIGYLSTHGTMDMNVAIRTMAHQADGISFGAGGAITADSDPQAEWHEVIAKAFALARAVALAQSGQCGEMHAITTGRN